jgi:hypothetical protein
MKAPLFERLNPFAKRYVRQSHYVSAQHEEDVDGEIATLEVLPVPRRSLHVVMVEMVDHDPQRGDSRSPVRDRISLLYFKGTL